MENTDGMQWMQDERDALKEELDSLTESMQALSERFDSLKRRLTIREVELPKKAKVLGAGSKRWVNGNAVRRLRKASGYTQRELGDLVGLPQSHVSLVERTGWLPAVHTGGVSSDTVISGLCRTLKCLPEVLMSRYDRKEAMSGENVVRSIGLAAPEDSMFSSKRLSTEDIINSQKE